MPTAILDKEEVSGVLWGHEDGPSSEFVCDDPPGLDDLERLYDVYSPRVYYLCLRMTGNPDDAEDLSQEAFLRMMQKLATFRGESAFYSWFRRLAINLVLLRYQKASWRREVSLEEFEQAGPVLHHHLRREFCCPDPRLAGAIDRISLERAIAQLPPGFKAVFILHDIEGYEHAEISRLMGCSIGTSKSQLHKARLRMRELLGDTPRKKASRSSPEPRQMTDPDAPGSEHRPLVLQFPRPPAREYEPPISRTA
jgi:RNA polymerase sigma-70 factor (ECF subfamily)